MNDLFKIAGGSVPGRSHMLDGKGNQDAYFWRITPHMLAAVVCDGCSAGANSEVGAKLGARLVVESLHAHFESFAVGASDTSCGWDAMQQSEASTLVSSPSSPSTQEAAATVHARLERVRQDLLGQVLHLANAMGPDQEHTLGDFFLFTIVGVVITHTLAFVFSLGDGVYAVNGEITRLGPFPDNAPPYLVYGLVETSLPASFQDLLTFQVHALHPSAEVDAVLIGTDGVAHLQGVPDHPLPGSEELVGPLQQFWLEDRYFRNSDLVRRRLARANLRLDDEGGLLADDTTLVVLRRKQHAGQSP